MREQAHAALRANEKRLRAIIDQMPAGVGVSDMGGTMVLSNALMDRFVPRAIPSTLADRVQRGRGWDDKGRPIPPENWPGRRALREKFQKMSGTYTVAMLDVDHFKKFNDIERIGQKIQEN